MITMTASMVQRPTPDPPEVLALVTSGMPLVEPMVRQLRQRLSLQVPEDDLSSFAREGLLMAARSFDAKRAVPFDRWATVKMRGAILEGLRRHGELSRRLHARLRAILASNDAEEGLLEEDAGSPPPTPEAADARLTAYLTVMATSLAVGSLTIRVGNHVLDELQDEHETVEEEVIREQLKARVREAIAERPPPERGLLEGYYFEGKTLEEASGGLSRSWSSRLLAQAMIGIAKSLRRARVEP
jgi:RNA polymerase sigma factor for flagellar operon FliA